MQLLFRCDASSKVGVGHVMRDLALAHEFQARGHKVFFCVNEEAVEVVDFPRNFKDQIIAVKNDSGYGFFRETMMEALPEGVDCLIIDHYGYSLEEEALFRPWARSIITIDDLACVKHDCDILIDQTYGRSADDYKGLVGKDTSLLLSSDYALLRNEFVLERENTLSRRQNIASIEKILISLGGGNMDGVLPDIFQAFKGVKHDFTVDLVLGVSGFSDEALLEMCPYPLTVHRKVTNMARLMSSSDIAIGGGGGTSWERCCLGLPTLLVTLAENQKEVVDTLVQNGAGIKVGTYASINKDVLTRSLRGFIENIDAVREMGANAASICDGTGCARVAEQIERDLSIYN